MASQTRRLPPPPYEVVLRGTVYEIIEQAKAFVDGKRVEGWTVWTEEETIGKNTQYMKVAIAARPEGETEGRDYVGLFTLTEQPDDLLFFRVPPRDSWDFRAHGVIGKRETIVIYKDTMFCQRAPKELGLRVLEELVNEFWHRGAAVTPLRVDPARSMDRRGF